MLPNLSRAHRNTYDKILRHPAVHNLHWRDVRSLLASIAEVVEEPNRNVRVTRNGQTLILHPDHHKDVGTEEQLKELRKFLERSDVEPAPPPDAGVNLLVVLDHREARIYRTELTDTVPERIVPYDPDGAGRHLHNVSDEANGQRRPERRSYYDAIAASLAGATAVLVFGSGTGASSAMAQLLAGLALHHKDLAARIVGSVTIDEHHLTEGQLLAKAREFYATLE